MTPTLPATKIFALGWIHMGSSPWLVIKAADAAWSGRLAGLIF